MKFIKVMAVCFWAVGIIVVLASIAVEVAMGADIGFVLITTDLVVVAGGCVLHAQIVRGKG